MDNQEQQELIDNKKEFLKDLKKQLDIIKKKYSDSDRMPYFLPIWGVEELIRLLEQEQKLIEMLKSARCPNENCDNAGTLTIAVKGKDGWPEPEPAECEWCWNREQLLNPKQQT